MERLLFYSSLALNAFLLLMIFYFVCIKGGKKKEQVKPNKTKSSSEVEQNVSTKQDEPVIKNQQLHDLALKCEAELPENLRNKVKILVEKESPELPAALQIDDIKIGIKRYDKNKSLFDVSNPMEALIIARDGYSGTGRYIPVPSELQFVIDNREVLNVYLNALELEEIYDNNEFWCVDTATGWVTGWKRFHWSVDFAHSKLADKFLVRTRMTYKQKPSNYSAKLFVLLKGWDHLFVEV